mgnify:CR=1 FL=1
MAVRAEEIASILREQIQNFDAGVSSANVGTVIEAGDGIARIHGLGDCLTSELIEFDVQDESGRSIRGLALNLEEETVGAVVSIVKELTERVLLALLELSETLMVQSL